MSPYGRVLPLTAILLAAAPAIAGERAVQEIVISFDGAHDNALWQRSRELAGRTGARFTYFLSCVYLLSPETRDQYDPPQHRKGRSNVGFAASTDDVAERLRQIWAAHGEGHEIASHGCGHFDGGDWSRADWQAEFAGFSRILSDAWTINGIEGEPAGWKAFARRIDGFRAPYLSAGPALGEAIAAARMRYDASTVSDGPVRPEMRDGVLNFALPMIPEGPKNRPIIAMDYNLFVRHSAGIERGDPDGAFEQRALAAFREAFRAEYDGERQPLQLGFHFTLMNGGAYWRALERFAGEACAKPDVACVSYRDLADRIEDRQGNPGG